jgi:hypothetical protein
MIVLNNRKAVEEYTAENTIECGLSRRARLTVYNQAVYAQFKTSPTNEAGQATWQPAPGLFVAPGSQIMPLKGLYGVRFKSVLSNAKIKELEEKKEGLAPQVTVLIFGEHE